mgnify:CR=1 FL=1
MAVADARSTVDAARTPGSGIRAGRQQPLFDGGNEYMDREYPKLDRILQARIVAPAAMPARERGRAKRAGISERVEPARE